MANCRLGLVVILCIVIQNITAEGKKKKDGDYEYSYSKVKSDVYCNPSQYTEVVTKKLDKYGSCKAKVIKWKCDDKCTKHTGYNYYASYGKRYGKGQKKFNKGFFRQFFGGNSYPYEWYGPYYFHDDYPGYGGYFGGYGDYPNGYDSYHNGYGGFGYNRHHRFLRGFSGDVYGGFGGDFGKIGKFPGHDKIRYCCQAIKKKQVEQEVKFDCGKHGYQKSYVKSVQPRQCHCTSC